MYSLTRALLDPEIVISRIFQEPGLFGQLITSMVHYNSPLTQDR